MNELISVIVPVYNVEQYVSQCVLSICNQTYTCLEILLIDDGSTDSSGSICDELSKKDSRIKVFHKTNGGLADARNYGLSKANGSYIGFVDSDDYINNDMYYYLLSLINRYNTDISMCSFYRCENELKYTNIDTFYSKKEVFKLLAECKIGAHVCNKLFRKSLFSGEIFAKGKVYEDVLLTYKLVDKTRGIAITQNTYYFYRINENSITNSTFRVSDLDLIYASKEYLIFLENNYPDIAFFQKQALIRHEIAILRKIVVANYNDNELISLLQKDIRNGIWGYLFSRYKLTSKLFGIIASINVKLSFIIYKIINKQGDNSCT